MIKRKKHSALEDLGYHSGALEDFAYAGKFLLVFIIVLTGIFYLPYKVGTITDTRVGKPICSNSIGGHISCWFQGVMSLFVGGAGLFICIFILVFLIILTIKIMDIWKMRKD